MAPMKVLAAEVQVSMFEGDLGGRANRICDGANVGWRVWVSRMTLRLEMKDDFWLKYLGGQG